MRYLLILTCTLLLSACVASAIPPTVPAPYADVGPEIRTDATPFPDSVIQVCAVVFKGDPPGSAGFDMACVPGSRPTIIQLPTPTPTPGTGA